MREVSSDYVSASPPRIELSILELFFVFPPLPFLRRKSITLFRYLARQRQYRNGTPPIPVREWKSKQEVSFLLL